MLRLNSSETRLLVRYVVLSLIISYYTWRFFQSEIVIGSDYLFLLDQYFLSQDIPHEVAPDRVFLSDGKIHLAAGWFYSIGNEPTLYNFQHPPTLKYLYGIALIWSQRPYLVQYFFGVGLLVMTYILGNKMSNLNVIGLLASALLVFDPILYHVSQDYLLDLGQAFFVLLYFYLLLYSAHWRVLAGIILGILFSVKFWVSSFFFVCLLGIYMLVIRKVDRKLYITHLLIAVGVYCFMYLPTFVAYRGHFNMIWFELRRLRYWLNHSVSSIPGASILFYSTGWLREWWGNFQWVKMPEWTLFWPISLLVVTLQGLRDLIHHDYSIQLIIYLIPCLYLLYLGMQAPFIRYLILIQPFLYLGISSIVIHWLDKKLIKNG